MGWRLPLNRNELTITVAKAVLITTLEDNRDKHARDYTKAKRGWIKLLRKELQTMLTTLDSGGELRLQIENQKPVSYLAEYVEAIEMLNFSSDDAVVLTAQQYRQYVKDDWDWKDYWVGSTRTYIEAG